MATKLISAGLGSVPKLLEINASWTDLNHTDILSNEAKTNQKLGNLVEVIGKVVKDLSPLLTSHIPNYLQKNKEMILELARAVNKVAVPSKLASNIAETIIDIAPQLLPIVTNLVNSALADPEGIANIITKFQDLSNGSGQEKTDKPIELLGDILEFINKKENQTFKKILEKDIPQFLTENAERLGPVIDEFLNKTIIGRNLKTKGEEIIKKISEHVPEINKLMTHLTKKEYLNVTSDIIKLLSDQEVRKLAVRALVASSRMLIQKRYTSLRTRRNKWNKCFSFLPEGHSWLPDQAAANDQKTDLGNLLVQYIDQAQISSKTVEYSIIERDFRGIILDPKNPIPTQQVIIDGFNFDEAIFRGRSFKNSNITNCSFKETILDNTNDFSGVTIDAKSLETLLPAIEKYNKSRKDAKDKITLDNVTIIGDVSNLTFKNISMKGADFTAAQFDSSTNFNGKQRSVEDILQIDLTNVKFSVNTQAKQIARPASSHVIPIIHDDNRVVIVNNSKRPNISIT